MQDMDATSGLPIVLLTDPIDAGALVPLEGVASIVQLGEPGWEDIVRSVRRATIVVVRRQIPEEALADARHLRALIRNGVGLDFIPVDAASRMAVAVVNTPGANARAVAEAVMGMILAGSRRLSLKDRRVREGHWAELREAAFGEQEIRGKTLGLVGFGAIAREVARIAHFGFDMSVIAASRSGKDGLPYVELAALPTVLSRADILVLACPLTDETRGMIGPHELAQMKVGAGIVNIARGPIIDEIALAAALSSGHLSFASLDVFCEQPLPDDHPFRELDTCVITPHTAGITEQAMARMSVMAVEEACRVLNGERPRNLVNTKSWSTIQDRWRTLSEYR